MKQRILVIILITLSFNIFSQEWSHIGLGGKSVWQLEIHEGTFYAATNLGFYKKEVNSEDTIWTAIGFENEPINRFVKYGDEIHLSKAIQSGNALYYSNDNGANWEEYQNGYGGGISPNAFTLARNGETGRLYAGGTANISISDNNGTSWTPTWGGWNWIFMGIGMITIDPTNTDVVYAGGMNAIFESSFFKSTDSGSSWAELGSPNGWGYDDQCMALSVDYNNSNTLYMAMLHNAVLKSEDAGLNWNEVLNITDPNPYIYAVFSDVKVDPNNSQTVYATKYTKHITNGLALQYLEMYKTANGGTDWETISTDVYGFTGGSELLLDRNGDVYLCSINRGVYKYADIVDFINTTGSQKSSFWPNPAHLQLNIRQQPGSKIKILDIHGKIVAQMKITSDLQQVNIEHLTKGIYFVHFYNDGKSNFEKLIIQ